MTGKRLRQRQTTLGVPHWLVAATEREQKSIAEECGGSVSAAEAYRHLFLEGCKYWNSSELGKPDLWLRHELLALTPDDLRAPLRTITVRFPFDIEIQLDKVCKELKHEEQVRRASGVRSPWWLQTLKNDEITLSDAARVALVWAVMARAFLRARDKNAAPRQGNSAAPAPDRGLPGRVFGVLEKAKLIQWGEAWNLSSVLGEVLAEFMGVYQECVDVQDAPLALFVGHRWLELLGEAAEKCALDSENRKRLPLLHNELLETHVVLTREFLKISVSCARHEALTVACTKFLENSATDSPTGTSVESKKSAPGGH